MIAQTINADPWRFQWHPEVWLLVGFLVVAYVYMVRVIGPQAVPEGARPVSTRNVVAFVAAMVLLWGASDWPIHDVGEGYLYSVHMFQHMTLSYFVPPLALLATPEWLLRVLIGDGRVYRAVRFLCRPVTAGLLFSAMVMVTHIPAVVNNSVEVAPLHYSVHVGVVLTSLLMWMPVCGPLPELQISPIGKCIYLFLTSVVTTVPAAWLVYAEGTVYAAYDTPIRVWGLSIRDDQQLAAAVMKTGGMIFLWTIIVIIFFRRFAAGYASEHDYHRAAHMPTAEITGNDEFPLTTRDVEREFARVPSPPED